MTQPPTRAPLAKTATDGSVQPGPGETAPAPPPAAASRRLQTLTRRAEFLACARARKAHTHAMVVQGRHRRPGEAEGVRVGFTASRKVGKAVIRNRARRRMREAARRVLPRHGREGWDYVLIARSETTVARSFAKLVEDLERALARLHGKAER